MHTKSLVFDVGVPGSIPGWVSRILVELTKVYDRIFNTDCNMLIFNFNEKSFSSVSNYVMIYIIFINIIPKLLFVNNKTKYIYILIWIAHTLKT